MKQKRVEQQVLILTMLLNGMMAIMGVLVYSSTRIQAVFLDTGYSIILILSSIVAILISKYSSRTSRLFPFGHYIYEPLYAILRAVTTLSLLVIATVNSVQLLVTYIYTGEANLIRITPVIPYIGLMIVANFGLSFYARYANKRINHVSTLMESEAKTAFVDGMMATGVGCGIMLFLTIKEGGPLSFLLYIGDSLITLLLVLFALKIPIRLLKQGFIELAGGVVVDKRLRLSMMTEIVHCLPEYIEVTSCIIRKIGMSYQLSVAVASKTDEVKLSDLQRGKAQAYARLQSQYPQLRIEYVVA